MSGVYALMDTLLPFEWLHYTFMKNALIAIVLLTPLFGMLGTMAVDNKMAFFSDALGHSALTGIAIGVVLSNQRQLSAILLCDLIRAGLNTGVKHHTKISADTIISVFSSTSIALGLVILAHGGGFAKYSTHYLCNRRNTRRLPSAACRSYTRYNLTSRASLHKWFLRRFRYRSPLP